MNPSDARDLAYSWHSGMWNPLYAFASSGIVRDLDALLKEIEEARALADFVDDDPMVKLRDLDDLHEFVSTNLTPRADGTFLAPWAHQTQEK